MIVICHFCGLGIATTKEKLRDIALVKIKCPKGEYHYWIEKGGDSYEISSI